MILYSPFLRYSTDLETFSLQMVSTLGKKEVLEIEVHLLVLIVDLYVSAVLDEVEQVDGGGL